MKSQAEPVRSDEARQLATWMPVVDQVIGEVMSKPKLASAIGGKDDVRQVAKLAVLQAIRSPKFAGDRRAATYLARCVRNAMRDAAAESALIRVPWRSLAALAESEGSPGSSLACNAQRAMRVVLMDDPDALSQEAADEDQAVSVQAEAIGCDVSAAVERLPAGYRYVIGHLYGVGEYQKLDFKQIAERLGIVLGTVRNRACKGRMMLKKILTDRGYGYDAASEGVSNGANE